MIRLPSCLPSFPPSCLTRLLPAEFQSICCGERMQVATKNKTAQSVDWKVPGIMGGNTVPGWEDQQGSIVRRIVLWLFNTPVDTVDTTLSTRLLLEMPALLLKANKAYLEAVARVGTRSIWHPGVLPLYFHKTREEMAEMTNTMRGFLASEAVVYDAEVYCPLTDVRAAWKRWVQDRNIPMPRWVPDTYEAPLKARGLRIANESRVYPRTSCGIKGRRQFVVGMDVRANMEQENDENADPNHQ